MGRDRGTSLIEAVVGIALIALGLLVAVPSLATLAAAGRAASGARHLAGTFQALRWKAVAQGTSHGLYFAQHGAGWAWWEVEDGNGNGLRTAEVASGVDRVRGGPYRLEAILEHTRLGFPPGDRFPAVPPGSGFIRDTRDPVQFGASDLVSFGPLGTASTGTAYVTDGRHRLYAVVLFGPTAKLRVCRYDTRTGRWSC
jgi:hypothetical protein